MRAVVTGATGFIGSHLVKQLRTDGWTVATIGRREHPLEVMQVLKPDVVFHLAAMFTAEHKPADVPGLVQSNIAFGCEVLEAMSVCGVRRLVNAGTSWRHYGGDDYNPVNLYAATKQAFADVARFYVEAGRFGVISLDPSDTYGPNDPRPKLFALLRKHAKSREPLAMSPGEQRIDLVYINDVVEAFITAAKRTEPWQTFAVRSGKTKTLRETVDLWQWVTSRRVDVRWGERPYRQREVMKPWEGPVLPWWQATTPLAEGIQRMEGLA